MRNYIGEIIPEPDSLVKKARQVLDSLNSIKPIRIKGNLIDKNNKYIAKIYFKNKGLNSYSYKTKEPNDISGIYVLYYRNKPMYVGISGTMIRRLKYHLFGTKDNESSFVYILAKAMHEEATGKKHKGKRSELPFSIYREKIQNEIKDSWSFKYYAIENGYELSFIEIYISCALKSKWNTFKTH